MESKRKSSKQKQSSRKRQSSSWMIVAIIAMVISIGLFVKVIFLDNTPSNNAVTYQTLSPLDDPLEERVRVVASNFRCACGGCGELPLAECFCDMPRGAKEEKDFIRNKLKEGFTVDQVIQMVEKKYGLRIT